MLYELEPNFPEACGRLPGGWKLCREVAGVDGRSMERVLELFAALRNKGVDYILVGGLALGLHGLARATEDFDLFVATTPNNIERLNAALRLVWDPHVDEITHQDLAGE